MQTATVRLGMSLMVVVGFWTNGLPAQEVLVVPTVPYEPAHQSLSVTTLNRTPGPAPANHWLHRAANNHYLGCGPDGYYNTCGGWRYEAHFIFGSCHSFFLQPCVPGHSGAHQQSNSRSPFSCRSGSCER